jgi:hypothetical protein
LKVVSQFGNELQFAHESLRADEEVVLAAVTSDSDSFKFANKALRKDKNFVLQVAARNPRAIFHAVPLFRKDREVILLAAVKDALWVEKFADTSLKDDNLLQLMVLASKVNQKVEFEDNKIKNTEEIIFEAVKEFGFSALRLIQPLPKPISPNHWRLIVRAAFSDFLKKSIYAPCRGPWSGRLPMGVDLVLLMNLSESMKPCLVALQQEIETVFSYLNDLSHELDYSQLDFSITPLIMRARLKFLGYKGSAIDGSEEWLESPFFEKSSHIIDSLNQLELKSGEAEKIPLLESLFKLSKINKADDNTMPDKNSWSPDKEGKQTNFRFVIAFTDVGFEDIDSEIDFEVMTSTDESIIVTLCNDTQKRSIPTL